MSQHPFRLKKFVIGIGGRPLLDAIDLDLDPGEMVAMTGPSGCGKSTLLRSAARLIDQIDGEVYLNDLAPREIGWPTFRRQVIYVSQQPVLFDTSVRDNLARPFSYAGNDAGFNEERAATMMMQLQLGKGMLHQNARLLSVGQQQRLCLVRALLVRPVVLLLDEPTSALDDDTVELVETLIRNYAHDEGSSVLIATHNGIQARRWCDRHVGLGERVVPTNATLGVSVQ